MMRTKGILAVAAAATMIMTSGATAATIVIDDFTVSQLVQDEPNGSAVNSSVVSDGMFGGTRYLEVSNLGSTNSGTQLNAQNGSLTFDNSSGETGVGYIVYDGTTDRTAATNTDIGVGVNTSGLNLNLLIGSEAQTFFSFDLRDFDPGVGGSTALFSAFAWDTSGNRADFAEVVGAGPISPNLFLSEFAGDDIDWTKVGALAFSIDSRPGNSDLLGGAAFGGPNFDGKVGAITVSAVPLPASVLMLLGGLGTFFGLSSVTARRQRKI
jgi:hypothetical protein